MSIYRINNQRVQVCKYCGDVREERYFGQIFVYRCLIPWNKRWISSGRGNDVNGLATSSSATATDLDTITGSASETTVYRVQGIDIAYDMFSYRK